MIIVYYLGIVCRVSAPAHTRVTRPHAYIDPRARARATANCHLGGQKPDRGSDVPQRSRKITEQADLPEMPNRV